MLANGQSGRGPQGKQLLIPGSGGYLPVGSAEVLPDLL